MASIRVIRENIEAHRSMQGLVEVYEEMAAETMRKIREAIIQSRAYYQGLARLSAEVGADLTLLTSLKSTRDALVLLSANEGMYGDIADKIFSDFLRRAKEKSSTTDIYVIGKVGADLMKMLAPTIPFTLLALQPREKAENLFSAIIKQLVVYTKIELFFGEFESIARQNPVSRVLSATEVELTKQKWAGDTLVKLKYLYEPSPEHVADTFATQIFAGIMEQTIKEDELAKNASRLMHLDNAWTKIEEHLHVDTTLYRKLKKRKTGKKQHTQLAGYIGRAHTKGVTL